MCFLTGFVASLNVRWTCFEGVHCHVYFLNIIITSKSNSFHAFLKFDQQKHPMHAHVILNCQAKASRNREALEKPSKPRSQEGPL